jgi:hypothetical protein
MEQVQLQKLKINATNIKNTLVNYNKQAIKLRKDEFRFSFNEDKEKKLRKKEEKIEGKDIVQQPLEKIKSKLLSEPLGFFDKVKEFFGIIFLGLVINNLPQIINKVTEVGKTLINVVNSIIKVVETAVNGVNGFISIIQSFPEITKRKLIEEKDKLEKFILELDKIIDPMNREYIKLDRDLKSKSTNSKPKDNSPTKNPDESQDTQKKSRGGTVRKPSRSKPAEKQTTKSTITGTFRGATPTPMGKKAIESTNSFETFTTVAEQVKEHSVLLDGKGGINENFTDVNESFSQFLINLKDKEDKDKKPPTSRITPGTRRTPPSPGTSTPGGVNAPSGVKVDPSDILGAIGSTGRSTGPHLHIETGDGYGGAGGTVPKNILDNVFIGGVPLSRLKQGDGLGAGRSHKGFDYPANSGSSLTIGGNLKFVEYDEGYNAGYGNSLIIMDENGNKYLLGHLSSGPTQSALKKIKEKQKPQVKPQQVSRKIGQSPEDSLLAMGGGVDLFVTQVVEKPVPFPMPVRVNSNSESSNNFIPEINPLLLS